MSDPTPTPAPDQIPDRTSDPAVDPTPAHRTAAARVGVHIGHCCARHGCKYADRDCPVRTRRAPQACLCEFCEEDPDPRTILTVEAVAEGGEEDSGQAVVMEVAADDHRETGEFVRLISWYPDGAHPVVRPLAGRKLRVTVQAVDDCPRCGMPLDVHADVSGADASTLICGSCGIEEALLLRDNQPLPPRHEWPVTERYAAALDEPRNPQPSAATSATQTGTV